MGRRSRAERVNLEAEARDRQLADAKKAMTYRAARDPEWRAWADWRYRGGHPAERPKGLERRLPPAKLAAWYQEYGRFLAWAQWRAHGGHPSDRPAELPARIARATLADWARRHHLLRAPRPVPAPPGAVFWASWGALAVTPRPAVDAIRGGPFTWVAVRPDLDTADDGAAYARQHGLTVVVWEAIAAEGEAAVARLGAAAWIAQAEGPEQLHAALTVGAQVTVPRALVTNLFMPDGSWPAGYACIPEAYVGMNAAATPLRLAYEAAKRGAPLTYPCLGLTNDGAPPTPLEQYEAELPLFAGGSVWTGESVTEGDKQLLAQTLQRR